MARVQRRLKGEVERRLARVAAKNPTAFGIKRRLQLYVGKRPAIFYRVYPLEKHMSTQAVTPETQLVVEGFPRSGNTFAVVALQQARGGNLRLAHHLHMPAQVMNAARWEVPTLVAIRRPEDAVRSFVLRNPQPVDTALRHYVMFYETVAEYRDAYVLGHFEEIVDDYGKVIRRINDRFGTDLPIFDHTEENVRKVFARIEEIDRIKYEGKVSEARVPRPSAARLAMKEKVAYRSGDPARERLISRAEAVYEHLADRGPDHEEDARAFGA